MSEAWTPVIVAAPTLIGTAGGPLAHSIPTEGLLCCDGSMIGRPRRV